MTRLQSLLRGLTGVLAGGLVVLALALGVAWVVATRTGSAGPAPWFLVGHAVAAVAAVVLQVRADRSDRRHTGAALGVLGISVAVLGVLWLA